MTNIALNQAPITMTSREIAELAGARHNKVVQTINRLSEKGLLHSGCKSRLELTGGRPTDVYDLNNRDTYLIIATYSDEARAKIIDRWMELETQAQTQLTAQVQLQALEMSKTTPEYVVGHLMLDRINVKSLKELQTPLLEIKTLYTQQLRGQRPAKMTKALREFMQTPQRELSIEEFDLAVNLLARS